MSEKPFKILFAEDNPSVMRPMLLWLKRLPGISQDNIFVATTCEEVRKQYAEHPDVDVIFMNYLLNKEDTIDLIREIKQTFQGELAAFTGISPPYITKMQEAGCTTVFAKPFAPETLTVYLRGKMSRTVTRP